MCLRVQSNQVNYYTIHFQAILSKQDASMQWQRCADLPVGTYNAQAVILGDKVYVGGGALKFPTESPAYIYVYDTTKNTWQLLASPCSWGALAAYQNQLVVAGGCLRSHYVTNKVWVLDEKEQEWAESIPPMPTARYDATAMGIDDYLTVLGGSYMNIVEIYDGHKWMKTDPLPVNCNNPWSVYHNGFCFIMGGERQNNSVFYTSFESLIEKTKDPSAQPSVWRKLPDVPYTASSPAIFGGSLVAIGGHLGAQKQKTIHMFLPVTRSWIQIAEMPIAVDCTCAVGLPWGELMVIGGHMKGEEQELIHEVHKASLKFQ